MNKTILAMILVLIGFNAQAIELEKQNTGSQAGQIGRGGLEVSHDNNGKINKVISVFNVQYYTGFELAKRDGLNAYVRVAEGLAQMCVNEIPYSKNALDGKSYDESKLVNYKIDKIESASNGVMATGSCYYSLK